MGLNLQQITAHLQCFQAFTPKLKQLWAYLTYLQLFSTFRNVMSPKTSPLSQFVSNIHICVPSGPTRNYRSLENGSFLILVVPILSVIAFRSHMSVFHVSLCWGWESTAPPFLILTPDRHERSGSSPAASSLGKQPSVTIEQEAGWTPDSLKRRISCFC